MKKIGVILLAIPLAVVGERVATDAMAGQYSPPILANGDIGMLIDYRNCQFQDVPSYKTIHAVGEKYLPGIYRAARRTENGKLAAFGRIEEHVSLAGDADAKPVNLRERVRGRRPHRLHGVRRAAHGRDRGGEEVLRRR